MRSRAICVAIVLGLFLIYPSLSLAQIEGGSGSASSPALTADCPAYRPGIFIRGSDWIPLSSEAPAKIHMKHAFAPTFTYGIAPAQAVSQYDGPHARVEIESGRPLICICHFFSLPGKPALVRLHAKKKFRELDAGKLHIGTKTAKAEKSDLIPVNVSQPENSVWVVQPQQTLAPGEYALMLGTQNMSIFPFSVRAASRSRAAAAGADTR